ncbi:hypothetical protein LX32DRAFT_639526 [Colletotrichum zoysiae]|uniref:Secreted protein n=1 Tax=Colletotrichum zoysiae TaxID=1216348 RepID=A0AAD9HIX4_9PEZI|nr:hypothetical protein LX32DRAFT_639526 [Colletotrichum zoysiae]
MDGLCLCSFSVLLPPCVFPVPITMPYRKAWFCVSRVPRRNALTRLLGLGRTGQAQERVQLGQRRERTLKAACAAFQASRQASKLEA